MHATIGSNYQRGLSTLQLLGEVLAKLRSKDLAVSEPWCDEHEADLIDFTGHVEPAEGILVDLTVFAQPNVTPFEEFLPALHPDLSDIVMQLVSCDTNETAGPGLSSSDLSQCCEESSATSAKLDVGRCDMCKEACCPLEQTICKSDEGSTSEVIGNGGFEVQWSSAAVRSEGDVSLYCDIARRKPSDSGWNCEGENFPERFVLPYLEAVAANVSFRLAVVASLKEPPWTVCREMAYMSGWSRKPVSNFGPLEQIVF